MSTEWGFYSKKCIDPYIEDEKRSLDEITKLLEECYSTVKKKMVDGFDGSDFIKNPGYVVLEGLQLVKIYYEEGLDLQVLKKQKYF